MSLALLALCSRAGDRAKTRAGPLGARLCPETKGTAPAADSTSCAGPDQKGLTVYMNTTIHAAIIDIISITTNHL